MICWRSCPRTMPPWSTFGPMNHTFGGLDVALVGIAVDDPFAPAFLGQLRTLTRRLNDEPTVAYALSLANVEDFVARCREGRYHHRLLGGAFS